jgi:hypothetical protein
MVHCLLLIGSLLAGQPATPAADELKTEVRRLVHRLDAPELAQREAAEAELLRRGPAILDLLPPDSRASAEVKQRLGRIRQKLQQQAAEAVARSSTITLKADAMPLADILAAFQRQSGNKITDARKGLGQPVTDPKLKLNFDKTPFWPALDGVLDQAGLALYPFSEQAAISIVALPPGKQLKRVGRASYVGPFRIEPTGVTARRDLRQPEAELLVLSVEVAWEPRLKIIGLMQRMADVKAVDERGQSLAVADAVPQLEIPAHGDAPAVNVDLPLKLPSRKVEKIASLRGKLMAMIPGRIETFRFTKLAGAKDQKQRIAGVTVTLEEVRKNNEALEVRMLVRYDDAGDALASHRTWIFANEAYLEGPDGKPIAHDTTETTSQGRNELGIAYIFSPDQPLDKLSFVYKTPGVIVTTGFDYELKDIRLP